MKTYIWGDPSAYTSHSVAVNCESLEEARIKAIECVKKYDDKPATSKLDIEHNENYRMDQIKHISNNNPDEIIEQGEAKMIIRLSIADWENY